MSDTIAIAGPVVAFRFKGNIKSQCESFPFVAACWLDSDETMVVIRLDKDAVDGHAAALMMIDKLGRSPSKAWFSKRGCDVMLRPNGQN